MFKQHLHTIFHFCYFHLPLFPFIAGNVDAIHDIWIIGDQFLWDTMKELSTMTKNVKMNKTEPPYMYEMCNISGYFAGFLALEGPSKSSIQ